MIICLRAAATGPRCVCVGVRRTLLFLRTCKVWVAPGALHLGVLVADRVFFVEGSAVVRIIALQASAAGTALLGFPRRVEYLSLAHIASRRVGASVLPLLIPAGRNRAIPPAPTALFVDPQACHAQKTDLARVAPAPTKRRQRRLDRSSTPQSVQLVRQLAIRPMIGVVAQRRAMAAQRRRMAHLGRVPASAGTGVRGTGRRQMQPLVMLRMLRPGVHVVAIRRERRGMRLGMRVPVVRPRKAISSAVVSVAGSRLAFGAVLAASRTELGPAMLLPVRLSLCLHAVSCCGYVSRTVTERWIVAVRGHAVAADSGLESMIGLRRGRAASIIATLSVREHGRHVPGVIDREIRVRRIVGWLIKGR